MKKRPALKSAPLPPPCAPVAGKHVVLIGLGVIGSYSVELVTRNTTVSRLTLVDRDVYEPHNLCQQAIQPEDIGKSKAAVQAGRACRIRPTLKVEVLHAAVENVPIGRLRGDVVLTGLDSKLSRQYVNQQVWRLGVPWVDAGVMAEGSLARVNVYRPAEHQPCLECAWGEKEYQTLEVARPCQAESGPRSGAPAFLGSLAAALQMAECEKILAGDWPSVAVGKQLTIAVAAHKLYETTFRPNPNCRFDHRTGATHPLHYDVHATSLGKLFAELKPVTNPSHPLHVSVEGRRFARELRCACGEVRPVLCLTGRMARADRVCSRCGGVMDTVGFSLMPYLDEATLQSVDRDQPLAAVGLQSGDFVTVTAGGQLTTFELIAL